MPKSKLFENNNDDELLDDDIEEMEDDLELDEDDIDEAHDPMNAEAKSNDSVDKAAKTGPKAKARRADKLGNGQKTAEKADKGIVRELYNKLNTMTKEDLRKIHSVLMDEDFSADEFVSDEEDVLENVDYDFSEDLNELISEEATLSEGFKEKSALIMETAIKSKLKTEVARLQEAYDEMFEEATAELEDELIEQVDGYLNLVVENWMKENELAIHNGLRTEIAEGFMNSLKDLFVESYIDVPEDRVNLVDDLAVQVEELESELNENVDKMISMKEELEQYQREAVIFEMADGLADTQIDKLAELAEAVDFDDEETFRERVATIKETYFGKKKAGSKTSMNESFNAIDSDDDDDEVEISPSMSSYVNVLRKTNKTKE